MSREFSQLDKDYLQKASASTILGLLSCLSNKEFTSPAGGVNSIPGLRRSLEKEMATDSGTAVPGVPKESDVL